jgi:putative membrane protein
MGQYHEVISAISGLKTLQLDYFVFLAVMSIGMGFGMLVFARVISFVFKRFYDGTVALMIGLTAGSLYALWPFKQTVVMDQYVKHAGKITLIENSVIQTNINILPGDIASGLLALLIFAVGAGIVIGMERYSKKLNV